MKALEVSIDGVLIGVYVPPGGACFTAAVGNIQHEYMRAHITTGTDEEHWQWQLPDIQAGQTISFRMIEAPGGSGVPPQFVQARDPREVAENKKVALARYGLSESVAYQPPRFRNTLCRPAECGRE
jgi:hypothetical protein